MRAVVADRHPRVRSALRLMLTEVLAAEEVAEADTPEELLARVADIKPDLVLLDWRMAEEDAVELLADIRKRCRARIVTLGGAGAAERPRLVAGADAHLTKGDSPLHVLAVLAGLMNGGE